MPSPKGPRTPAARGSEATVTIAAAVEACRRRLLPVATAPWLEARLLTSHVTGLDASAIVAYGDNILEPARLQRLADLTARRLAGEPLAYIVGFKEFCGLRIMVDGRVLVPRPETEELVHAIVADWRGRAPHVLDLGTGSGAISCALARFLPNAHILATDISEQALDVARTNVERHLFGERIHLAHGDLFDAVPPGTTFDVIAANLPYVRDGDVDLEPTVRANEPHVALFGGRDGLDVFRRVVDRAGAYMKPDGALYCECSPDNAYELAGLARDAIQDSSISVRADVSGRERFVVVRRTASNS
ncbi:MAG TPA: peptide chain release factor N(5)-glutamine methyltransferase [Candidatus Eremiobacteraceae bacterium]|nr:peptide chain release factor N(5)-glutamine methyltransferase [Candidatus Eremiobacteraceae bacterium]